MNKLVVWFVKLTGLIPNWFYFRRKTYYINKKKQGRKIKGGAIVVSNHTSLIDFPLYMFLFFSRTLRPLVAEVMFQKSKFLSFLLKGLGAIRVERNSYDFSFVNKTIDLVNKKRVALIFPESRLPRKEETDLLEFKPSFVYIALETGAPIIPVYTNGGYKKKKRAKVMVGEKIYLTELYDDTKTEKENIDYLCNYVRDYIKMLGDKLYEIEEKSKK